MILATTGCLVFGQLSANGGVRDAVGHRAEARRALSTCREAAVCERWLADADPEVRKFALARLYACDEGCARTAAERLRTDPSAGVKALAENILRPRTGSAVLSRIPLSQDKSVDHEILRVKTVVPQAGRFTLPAKIDSDAVELWFARTPTTKVVVELNGVPAYEFDPARTEGRAFRADITESVRWNSKNAVRVVDDTGAEQPFPFEVEVLKCGG